MSDEQRRKLKREAEDCAICGKPSDELNSEGECPGCVDDRESEEAGDA